MKRIKGEVSIKTGNAYDVLKTFPDNYFNCIITSPPYWGLRDYNIKGQIGTEEYLTNYIHHLSMVFREIFRVLHPSGVFWLNIGDSYSSSGGSGSKEYAGKHKQFGKLVNIGSRVLPRDHRMAGFGLKRKELCGIPWRLAFSAQNIGFYLRSDIIWAKPNPMPESVRDRPTRSHEYMFMLTKSEKYFFDKKHMMEPALDGKLKAKRDVFNVQVSPFKGAHFATFPERLIEPCILSSTPDLGICEACGSPNIEEIGTKCKCNSKIIPARVLDPFCGSGTAGVVSIRGNRSFYGIDLSKDYVRMAYKRIFQNDWKYYYVKGRSIHET